MTALEDVAERALEAYRGAQHEIERLRAAETETRVRLAKTISHAKRAIRAYRDSQLKVTGVEADLREAEADLAAAEAARVEAMARAEASERRAGAVETTLADFRRRATEAKDRLARDKPEPDPDPDPVSAPRPEPPRAADRPPRHAERPKALDRIEGRLKRIGSDATRGARRRAA